MKKIILYTSVVGLAIGIVAYLLKRNKIDNSKIQTKDSEFDRLKTNTFHKESEYEPNVVGEMMETRSSSVQSIHGRHTEAADIMCSAFENIYKDIEPVVSDDKAVDSVVDESVITNNELDSLSDELDDLLK